MATRGRNDPCHCGSGKKYKKCHLSVDESERQRTTVPPEILRDLQVDQRFAGPRSKKIEFHGSIFRIFWNQLDIRKPTETFHEYLLHVLKRTFGQPWLDTNKRPNEARHVVMRWLYAWGDLSKQALPADHKPGERIGVAMTGDVKALVVLADDLFRLQLVHRLPHRVLERLRNPEHFQGARYEVAVAAIFARCGFEIEWIDDKGSGKRCEFTARHPATGLTIAVEAKSRHRSGVLNHPGTPVDLGVVRADLDNLFKKALAKAPGDKAFGIFMDLNLPRQQPEGLEKPWMEDMKRVLDSGPPGSAASPSPYNLLVVTNYSWHYDASEPAGGSEFLIVFSPYSQHSFADAATLETLHREIQTYGRVPEDE